jgi:hypothetical protein
MKKLVILAVTALLLTGCTVVRIDTSNIDNIVSVVLSKNNDLYNRVGKGYKYYIPRGVSHIDTSDLNEKLYSEGNYYYLYIDAISYFHNKELDYNEKENAYYSKKIEINNKEGYLEINKVDNLYFIEFMYNYGKIEALVPKNSIETVVLNATYILSTVKFNHNVIELMLDENYFTSREEVYDIFSAKEKIDTSSIKKLLEYEEE